MLIEKDGMAWTGRVLSISPIENANKIQKTEVGCGKGGKWIGVTTKEVQINDLVVVFLSDAVLPQIEVLSFMAKHNWRVKMCRLRGCPSEVLIIPIGILGLSVSDTGEDVTKILNVKKYEKEIPAQMSGEIYGAFPSFIPKTDELNFQSVPEFRSALVGKEFYVSEKYDGSSLTIYYKDGHIGVCSRNWEMKESDNIAGWQIVKRYGLKEKLPLFFGNLALQMELIGVGIQGNPLKLSQIEVRVFDVYDIDQGEHYGLAGIEYIANELKMPIAKVISQGAYTNYTDDELRQMAKGYYCDTNIIREGIVIRPVKTWWVDGQRLSFKVINLDYKN